MTNKENKSKPKGKLYQTREIIAWWRMKLHWSKLFCIQYGIYFHGSSMKNAALVREAQVRMGGRGVREIVYGTKYRKSSKLSYDKNAERIWKGCGVYRRENHSRKTISSHNRIYTYKCR